MIRSSLFALLILAVLNACTWVKLEPAGKATRVAREDEDLSYCDRRGEITVSVKHSVAFIERNALKVRDELETMARNEAMDMSADTVRAAEEPMYGEQRFVAFACRSKAAAPAAAAPVESAPRDGAETFPIPPG